MCVCMGVHRKAVMHAHSSLAGNQTQLKKKALIFLASIFNLEENILVLILQFTQ